MSNYDPTQDLAAYEDRMLEPWLIEKRGLYYMPNSQGYTGIRDHAGHYTEQQAKAEERIGDGIKAIPLSEAPEFSRGCWDDVARKHLSETRDTLRELLRRVDHTLSVHGHMDRDTDLHQLIQEAIS